MALRYLVAGLLLITTLILGAGCGTDAQSAEPEEADAAVATPVEAALATTGAISAYYTGTATLEAEEDAVVVAKAGGIVSRILAEEGQYVRAGQTLAQLDDERLRLELDRAGVTLAKLEREAERMKAMHEKRLVSAEEYERVRSDFETQRAAMELARLAVDYTTVRSPISGVVSERMVKVGNMVQTNAPAFRVTDFDPLLAVMHVPERELGRLGAGQEALIYVDALPGQSFRGRIARISPLVDPSSGTFKVTVAVDADGSPLKPGMFGRVRIVYDTRGETTLVPKDAVIREDDRIRVFVVRDSLAFGIPVELGYEDDLHVEVRTGIVAGDRVVTTGQRALRDSALVEIIN